MSNVAGLREQERIRMERGYERIMAEANEKKESRRNSMAEEGIRMRYAEQYTKDEINSRRSSEILPHGATHQFDDGGIGQKPLQRQQTCSTR